MVGDRVKRAARDAVHVRCGTYRADPIENLAGGTPGEGEQQDPLGRDPLVEQILNPRGQGGRLSGTGPGDYAQRLITERGRLALMIVEIGASGEHGVTVVRGCDRTWVVDHTAPFFWPPGQVGTVLKR